MIRLAATQRLVESEIEEHLIFAGYELASFFSEYTP